MQRCSQVTWHPVEQLSGESLKQPSCPSADIMIRKGCESSNTQGICASRPDPGEMVVIEFARFPPLHPPVTFTDSFIFCTYINL